jgi:hypothetical protein
MKILIFGSTGMVRREVLQQCLAIDKVQSILTVGRRISGIKHLKLKDAAITIFSISPQLSLN